MSEPVGMQQTALYPRALAAAVETLMYRPGWTFALEHIDRGQGSIGLTLIVTSLGYDTYHPENGETYRVRHYMPVPPAAFDARAWYGWLLEQLVEIETHEACEFLVIDGKRPFAPNHGPGRNPYQVIEHGTTTDAETSFRGRHKADSQ